MCGLKPVRTRHGHRRRALEFSADREPADRRFDRLLAKLDLIHDAAPLFRDGARVTCAGVLVPRPACASMIRAVSSWRPAASISSAGTMACLHRAAAHGAVSRVQVVKSTRFCSRYRRSTQRVVEIAPDVYGSSGTSSSGLRVTLVEVSATWASWSGDPRAVVHSARRS
jgi:hypothetical protein